MTRVSMAVVSAVLFCLALNVVSANARPAPEIGGPSPAVQISGSRFGNDFFCAVQQDSTVQCWGTNASGQLGEGSTGGQEASPVFVKVNTNGTSTNLANAIAVSVGGTHACALLSDGSVRCWGNNSNGQLGSGTPGGSSTAVPVKVPFVGITINLTNVKAIAAGRFHTCALLTDGTVRCWGDNVSGQLGDGTTGNPVQLSPVQVGGLSNAVSITAGSVHTCALLADGTVRCWGSNSQRQLGNGTTGGTQPLPAAVVGIDNTGSLTNIVSVSAGNLHTCALSANGSVQCWGDNFFAQLGDGTNMDSNFPVVLSGLTNVASLSAGSAHSCAMTADGTVRCWGANGNGRLGLDTSITSQPTPPASSISGLGGVLAIAAGFSTTCASQSNEVIQCWGSDAAGSLGNDLPLADSSTPVAVTGSGGSISGRTIAAGRLHSCATRGNGTAACWGENFNGQLGNLGTSDSSNPSTVKTFAPRGGLFVVVDLTGNHQLSGGGSHTCALAAGGTVKCWGFNGSGQLGTGDNSEFHVAPTSPIQDLTNVISISTGQSHSCAVLASGKVKCWGLNDRGQLGNNKNTDSFTTPQTVQQFIGVGGLGNFFDLENIVMVSAGAQHTCALRVDGNVFCWGDNSQLQIGRFMSPDSHPPFAGQDPVVGLSNVVAIAAGGNHTCALTSNGKVKCWGSNDRGQLGANSLSSSNTTPLTVKQNVGDTQTDLSGIVSIAGGGRHSCALRSDGRAFCWGDNNDGELGTGDFFIARAASTPVKQLFIEAGLVDLPGIIGLGLGFQHSCALRVDGQPFCWGANGSGQRGDATNSDRSFAAAVPSFTFNIAPNVALRNNQRVLVVTALANCPDGDHVHFDVQVTQGATSGQGQTEGTCTGGLSTYSVTVPAQGPSGFQPGAAQAQARAVIRDGGHIADVQDWTRAVELAIVP